MRLLYGVGMLLALLTMAGCVRPYQIEIQQGNVVTREMIDKLKPGMTKNQVRFVLGTPLVTDEFHPDRWDYVYLYKKDAASPVQRQQLTVIFDGDAMKRIEGDLAQAPAPVPEAPNSKKLGDENQRPQSPVPSSTARTL
jgi:outer membrane protein assembly factor BamE